MKHRHLLLIGLVAATAAASCSSSSDEAGPATGDPDTSPVPPTAAPTTPPTTAPPTTAVPTTSPATAPPTTIDPDDARTAAQLNEYVAQAAAFDQAGADAQFPQGLTFAAGGAPGYSRYVFREHSDGVVPTLNNLPPGCAFEPRCAERLDICRQAVPELTAVAMDHRARCVRVEGGGLGRASAFAEATVDKDALPAQHEGLPERSEGAR